MVALVISDARLISTDGIAEYRRIARASIEEFGGRYVAMTKRIDVLEGDWTPEGLTILEFPDADAARAWYRSAAYSAALPYARRTLERSMIIVDQSSSLE